MKTKGNNFVKFLLMLITVGILTGMASRDQVTEQTKKVLDILPLMNTWREAYSKWADAHDGVYIKGGSQEDGSPTAADLGVNWPSDWTCEDDSKVTCRNEEWYCGDSEDGTGGVVCANDYVSLSMFQWDAAFTCLTGLETFEGKTICMPGEDSKIGRKVCSSLGRLAKGCLLHYIISE